MHRIALWSDPAVFVLLIVLLRVPILSALPAQCSCWPLHSLWFPSSPSCYFSHLLIQTAAAAATKSSKRLPRLAHCREREREKKKRSGDAGWKWRQKHHSKRCPQGTEKWYCKMSPTPICKPSRVLKLIRPLIHSAVEILRIQRADSNVWHLNKIWGVYSPMLALSAHLWVNRSECRLAHVNRYLGRDAAGVLVIQIPPWILEFQIRTLFCFQNETSALGTLKKHSEFNTMEHDESVVCHHFQFLW